jgi:hypothetical protein
MMSASTAPGEAKTDLEDWAHWDGEPVQRAKLFAIGSVELSAFICASTDGNQVHVGGTQMPEAAIDIMHDALIEFGSAEWTPCDTFWATLEARLREAECEEYLDDIRDTLADHPLYLRGLLDELLQSEDVDMEPAGGSIVDEAQAGRTLRGARAVQHTT